jgi:HTH-type transcriptional regulator / antitoxin HigA
MDMAMRRPAEVFPPGDFLREELEERGWTQTDLAEILDRPIRVVNEIIMGKRRISPDTAKGLAAALGTSPEFWLNLESAYQLWRVGTDNGDAISRRARLFSFGLLRDLLRRGWIERSDSLDVVEKRVTDFYEVPNLNEEPRFDGHAARKSTSYSTTTLAQTAWLYRAKKLARAVPVGPYSKAALNDAIAKLRLLLPDAGAIRRVPQILSDAGIRFIVVEALPGTRIDGACFWLEDSPVIVLSMRFDRIDSFWHTLMHELGHLSSGDRFSLDTDLDAQRADDKRPESERLADRFAVEQLIPQGKLDSFISRVRPLYSAARIEAFAQTCGVHPGVVVGQLQHRREIPWANLRKMLVPVRAVIGETALIDGWGTALPAQS